MIEDMYKEETGEAELESNSSSDNKPRSKDKVVSCEEKEDLKCSMSQAYQTNESKANIEMVGFTGAPASFHNEANSDDGFMNLLLKDQRPGEADGGLLHDAAAHHADESARFMAYHLAELGGYRNSNVSLTLGLQHTENSLLAPNTHQPGFTAVEEDMYNTTAPPSITAASSDYELMNQLDQRQQFEPPPLLHDFVA
jgi:hypothetical protein